MDEPLFEYLHRRDMARKFYLLRVDVSNSSTNDVLTHAFPRASAFHQLPYTLRDALKEIGCDNIKQYCDDNELIADDDVYFVFVFENIGVRVQVDANAHEIQFA
jgi:hypothetical protein